MGGGEGVAQGGQLTQADRLLQVRLDVVGQVPALMRRQPALQAQPPTQPGEQARACRGAATNPAIDL